jgi:hypothetical protein
MFNSLPFGLKSGSRKGNPAVGPSGRFRYAYIFRLGAALAEEFLHEFPVRNHDGAACFSPFMAYGAACLHVENNVLLAFKFLYERSRIYKPLRFIS